MSALAFHYPFFALVQAKTLMDKATVLPQCESPHCEPYAEVRRQMRSGDVLLFRGGPSWLGRLISTAGRSIYCHAAMAAWWDGRLMALEMLQFRGGRAVLLSNLVAENVEQIDVYRVNARPAHFDRRRAVEAMKEFAGRPYGWGSLLRCGMRHVPLARFLVRADLDDRAGDGRPPFCSQAVAFAMRAGGIDPVPNLNDRLTEPGDLARSSALAYVCTLK